MTSSRSWKLPKPLRFVGRLFLRGFGIALELLRRLRRHIATANTLCRVIPQAVLFYHGSWRLAIRSVLGVLAREGFTGVTRRANILMGRGITDRNQKQSSIVLYSGMPPPASGFMPKVSIIVPNFNHAKYLLERLESIYGQTYSNVEVILLDDCSSDESVSILHAFAERYPGKTICRFNEVNSGGVFNQWKKGLELATGELVWIAESDDFCDKDFLEKLVPFFSDESIMLSYAHSVFVDRIGKQNPFAFEIYVSQIAPYKWNNSYVETAHIEVNTALGLLNTIPNVSSVLFKKPDDDFQLFNDANWKKMKVCGDWLFYLYLIRGGRIAYCNGTHNYYRIHQSSTSKKTHSQDIYYQEHLQVACAIAILYKIPDDLFIRLQKRLKDFYFKNVDDATSEKFDALFNLSILNQYKNARYPNILMAIYGFAFGGGEILPIRLSNALKKAGASVTIFNGGYELTQPGVRKMLSSQIAVINNTPGLDSNEMLANYGIEIIHSHHASMENYFAITRETGANGVKHVATMHGMYEMMSNNQFIYNTKAIQKSVDHWVYTAEKNILPFKKNGLFNPEKFTQIDNGMQIPKTHRIDLSPLGITSDSFTACLASRALPEKGWIEAIEATKRVREITKKDVHLVLIGEGPIYDVLRRKELPFFIHLLGYKADLADYIASSQLGLLPTYFMGESFPLVMIEFFMAEIPVIASNIGEISKMIITDDHKIGGSLIELRNGKVASDELADAMIKIVIDRKFYNNCVSAARVLKTRFTIDNIANQYIAVYKRTLFEN